MTDDKKKPEDETPKAQAEDAKPAEDLSDEELGKAAGGGFNQTDETGFINYFRQTGSDPLSG